MKMQHLMEGWSWVPTTANPNATFVTGAAYRNDDPAGLPQVTAEGRSPEELRANLVEKALEYEAARS